MEPRSCFAILFLLSVVVSDAEGNTFRELLGHVEKNYPQILPAHSSGGERTSRFTRDINFSEEELAKLRRILEKGPIDKDGVIGRMLAGERLPDVSTMEELDPMVFVQKLTYNEEYRERLGRFLVEHITRSLEKEPGSSREQPKTLPAPARSRASDPWSDDDYPDDPQDRDQIGGYEGCKRDYDTLALPATTSLLFRILSSVPLCEMLLEFGIPGEILDFLSFCDCSKINNNTWDCNTVIELPPPNSMNDTFCQDVIDRIPDDSMKNTVARIMNLFVPFCECDVYLTRPPVCTTDPISAIPINATVWGTRMIDALAKVPTGLADGKLHWAGGFEMCTAIDATYTYTNRSAFEKWDTEERHVKGRYCRMHLGFPVSNGTRSIPMAIGLCVPDTCEEDWIYRYITEDNLAFMAIGAVLGAEITSIHCKLPQYRSEDSLYLSVISVLLCIFILIIIAALYDIFRRKNFVINHYGAQLLEIHNVRKRQKKAGIANGGPLPPGYTHVHADELRRYSVGSISSGDLTNLQKSISRQTSSAALVDEMQQEMPDSEPDPKTLTIWERVELFCVGWSAYSNLHRILDTGSPPGHIPALDGIRVFSFAWSMLGGMYLWGPVYNECFLSANLFRALRELPAKWSFQPVLNFGFSSDSFLVISGTMITYWWLKRFESQGNKLSPWLVIHYIVHRYWRLVPAYMLVLYAYVGTYSYSGDGPFFTVSINDGENCGSNWWTNLLLVMNIVNQDGQCLGWSWQLSILFQLHVVSLVVLIPLVIKPIIGYIVLGALYIISLGAAAGESDRLHGSGANKYVWYQDYMQMPWCRAGPFCVGLALGIILQKYRKIKLHWAIVLGCWILSLVCITTPIYCTYDQWRDGGSMWGRSAAVAYDTLARTAFGLGLAWIIFACHYGYGSAVNTLLSQKIFRPMSKLTYGAFLVHVLMAYSWAYSRFTLFYFSTVNMAWLFLGQMWVAYVVGAMVLLLFHYPFSCAIERALTCKSRMHALLTGRYPGDYFDQFHEAQRLQVSEVDNSEKEAALREAGFVNPGAFSRQSSISSNLSELPGSYDNNVYLRRSVSQDALPSALRKTSWQA